MAALREERTCQRTANSHQPHNHVVVERTFRDQMPPSGVEGVVGTPTSDAAAIRLAGAVLVFIRRPKGVLPVETGERVDVTLPPAQEHMG